MANGPRRSIANRPGWHQSQHGFTLPRRRRCWLGKPVIAIKHPRPIGTRLRQKQDRGQDFRDWGRLLEEFLSLFAASQCVSQALPLILVARKAPSEPRRLLQLKTPDQNAGRGRGCVNSCSAPDDRVSPKEATCPPTTFKASVGQHVIKPRSGFREAAVSVCSFQGRRQPALFFRR